MEVDMSNQEKIDSIQEFIEDAQEALKDGVYKHSPIKRAEIETWIKSARKQLADMKGLTY